MPWSEKDATRFKKDCKNKKKWATIANAILRKSGDEGKAIRIANSKCDEDKERPSLIDTFDIGQRHMIDFKMPFGKKKKRKRHI